MAKDKAKDRPAMTPDLPDVLGNALARARAGTSPPYTDQDEAHVPQLWQFLEPRLVADPRYKGNGSAGKVLREPMVMLSWDRLSGSWKWTLTDKVLNVTGILPVPGLVSCVVDLEMGFTKGTIQWKEKKVT